MKITFDIDDKLLEKFNKSLEIMDESKDNAFFDFVEDYIMVAYDKLQKYIDELKQGISTDKIDKRTISYANNDYKGVSRIPKWARSPSQYNHRILRAFLQLEKENKFVRLERLEQRCHDKANYPEVYVPKFRENFSQMKFDEGKSHGKIFEEKYGVVTIWGEAREAVEKHREFFE